MHIHVNNPHQKVLFLIISHFYCLKFSDISVARASVDPAHSVHGSNLSPPTVLQFGKTRKLSAERADPRK
jgi:hypothetical protein